MKGKMKGNKIKGILLITVFILTTLAVAIPVSAQVYEDFATHEIIWVHEWPIEPLPDGDGLAIAVWYEDGFTYFEVTIPECYLPAETSHPGFTFDVDADGYADFQIMYGPDWKYMEADLNGWIPPASDIPEEFITSHEPEARVFTLGVPISVLGGYGSTYKFGVQAQRHLTYIDGDENLHPDASRNIYISTEPGYLWYNMVDYYHSDYYVDNVVIECVTYDLNYGPVGTKTTVAGLDATPLGKIRAYWDGLEDIDELTTDPAIVKADGTGAFEFSINVPEDVAGIIHYIVVKDMESDSSDLLEFTITPKIVLDPTAGVDGDTITVTGTGFGEEEVIEISYPTNVVLTTTPTEVTTSTLGSFDASFDIPDEMTTDPTTITAKGDTSGVSAKADISYGTVMTLIPDTGLTGITVTIEGKGFEVAEIIDVRWVFSEGGFLTLINDYTIGSTGEFTETFTVPPVDTGIYTVKAVDDETVPNMIVEAEFTVTGETAITLDPITGLVGDKFEVDGVWFTASSTVDITFGGTIIATDVSTDTDGAFTESDLEVPDVALGIYTVTVTDEDGIFETAAYTVIEEVITIETNSESYDPGDTISFTIESTVAFDPYELPDTLGTIAMVIDDPDGYTFWSADAWAMEGDVDTGFYVPYSAQLVNAQHMTLPSDAEQGIWDWTATYEIDAFETEVTGTFTVGEVEPEPQPELPAETTDEETLDPDGAPKTSFVMGESILASASVENVGTESQVMLIVFQLTDPDYHVIPPNYASITLPPGLSLAPKLNFLIPTTGYTTGTWTMTVMIIDDWPAQGGEMIGEPVTFTFTVE